MFPRERGHSIYLNGTMSRVVRTPVFAGSDQVRHTPGSTITEGGERIENSDLGSRRIVQSMWRKQRC